MSDDPKKPERSEADLGTVALRPPSTPSAGPDPGTVMLRPATTPAATPAPTPRVTTGETDRFIGQTLGGYEVVRKLAEGGMGVVYEGRHTKLGRRGAIKVLKLEYCQSDDVVERFY